MSIVIPPNEPADDGDRENDRLIGQHHARIDALEKDVDMLKSTLIVAKDDIERLMNRSQSAYDDSAVWGRIDEMQKRIDDAVRDVARPADVAADDAVDIAKDAIEAPKDAIEDIEEPEPKEPRRTSKGFLHALKRLA